MQTCRAKAQAQAQHATRPCQLLYKDIAMHLKSTLVMFPFSNIASPTELCRGSLVQPTEAQINHIIAFDQDKHLCRIARSLDRAGPRPG